MPSPVHVLSRLGARMGLEAKFVILATAVLIAGSSAANRLVFSYERSERIRTAEQKGKLLAESMGISFTHTLLYEEIGLVSETGLMDNFIRDILRTPEMDVRSVAVYDPDGRVIAHDDPRQYGRAASDALATRALASWETVISRYERDGRSVMDVATPLHIASKRWGTLRLVISLDDIRVQLRAFALRLFGLTVAAVVLGVVLALAVARALARPIKRLAAAMQAVDADIRTDFRADRADEIGLLQHSFLDMLARLREAVARQVRMRQMLVQTERLASIGTLAAGVAHEINNPLAGVKTCLQRIRRKPEDAEQTRTYAALMSDAVDRIGRVVTGMLDFARQEELSFEDVDVVAVLREAIALVDHRVARAGIDLQLRVPDGAPVVQGDPHRIGQVFLNLFLNAVDAMPGGGTLEVCCRADGQEVITTVRDTGEGIPEGRIDRVFDPFYTTKEVGKGTGLGLSVSHGIVEDHGGRLTVRSTVGEGTVFEVALPVDGPGERSTTAAAPGRLTRE